MNADPGTGAEQAIGLAGLVTAASAWLAETILSLGYTGIILLMAIESSFVPFPSELVMPPAGYQVHEGNMNLYLVLLAGLFGSLAGAWINYFIALRFGRPFFLRYGKYFLIKPENIDKADQFFAKHGEITTFVGRLIPVIRQLISLPAGAARMPLGKFTFYTGLGALIWISILTWIGWLVGRNQELLHLYMRDATLWALGGVCVVVMAYIHLYRRRKKRVAEAAARMQATSTAPGEKGESGR
ncbi:MAG: DedA family protein [Planctomycetes bacterium]|nr:DedA family protein [Planctomycetota bacterium]